MATRRRWRDFDIHHDGRLVCVVRTWDGHEAARAFFLANPGVPSCSVTEAGRSITAFYERTGTGGFADGPLDARTSDG